MDYAIIAGIGKYVAFNHLDGPENDARAFLDWLCGTGELRDSDVFAGQGDWSPATHRARLIVSSTYGATTGRPDRRDLVQAFRALDKLSQEREQSEGGRVGRRLYVFFAGHGFADSERETALLSADADERFLEHVAGRSTVAHFLDTGVFDEAVLFMDCCRESPGRAKVQPLPFVTHVDDSRIEKQRLFCALSAKWRKESREIVWNGNAHGAFTAAVLEGLRTAIDVKRGGVSGRSLADYLRKEMRNFLPPSALRNGDIATVPDIFPDQPSDDWILFVRQAQQPMLNVTFQAPAVPEGFELQVIAHDPYAETTWPLAHGRSVVPLQPGGYVASVPGFTKMASFTVHATVVHSNNARVEGTTIVLERP